MVIYLFLSTWWRWWRIFHCNHLLLLWVCHTPSLWIPFQCASPWHFYYEIYHEEHWVFLQDVLSRLHIDGSSNTCTVSHELFTSTSSLSFVTFHLRMSSSLCSFCLPQFITGLCCSGNTHWGDSLIILCCSTCHLYRCLLFSSITLRREERWRGWIIRQWIGTGIKTGSK